MFWIRSTPNYESWISPWNMHIRKRAFKCFCLYFSRDSGVILCTKIVDVCLFSNKDDNSSDVNEVIRAVLNPLFFFLQKDFAHTKSTKSTKTQPGKSTNTNKQISDFFPLDVFYGHFFIFVRLCAFLCLIKM